MWAWDLTLWRGLVILVKGFYVGPGPTRTLLVVIVAGAARLMISTVAPE